ncbi:hypothetical protein, partial [Curtobacterium sp. MCBD17_028]|uniref:hyaluronate lyase N-terminal domain-containing protein n=1 Tax=Curtobacterium sp. MCBD17_028 TaxID=2175670 RepID=UPI000DB5DD79
MVDEVRRQERGGLKADLLAANQIPLEREIVVAIDTGDVWIGDGVSPLSACHQLGQGPAGSSAYQSWLNLGNTGSEADFIASLGGGVSPLSACHQLG